jgi:hypothetical protein
MWVEWSRMADYSVMSEQATTHHNGKVNAMQYFHTKDKHLESLVWLNKISMQVSMWLFPRPTEQTYCCKLKMVILCCFS